MSEFCRRILVTLLLIVSGNSFAAQGIWQDVTPVSRLTGDQIKSIRYFHGDDQELRALLNQVPNELRGQHTTIQLPMPDGTLASYSIVESPIMETSLAEEFSQIKTYKVYGIDDPIASGRVDINDKGLHAMLQTSEGRVFIDPDTGSSSSNQYLVRTRDANQDSEPFYCSAGGEMVSSRSSPLIAADNLVARIPGSLQTYRIAVSATKEYSDVFGSTTSSVMSEITTAINRVNEIYERDLGIRLILAAGNSSLIDLDGTSLLAGLNSNGFALLAANQVWIDSTIGNTSYDIGHVFSTGGGGVAFFEVVCDASFKAGGVTGLPSPTGDPFYIDYVAHEIGHQFGADHTFNGTTSNCGSSNRNAATAVEPGSGSTIMAYAGLCGSENIQLNSEATYHAASISQINTFVTSGGGASCDVNFSFSNSEPTANAGLDHTIPVSTPFILVGAGTDADTGDTLSYQWDQMDAGTATDSLTFGQDLVDNTLFRTFIPQCNPERNFPNLRNQLDGIVDPAEALPTTPRDVNFRLTVRDGKSGQATDDILISVDNSSGPFRITSHTTSSTIFVSSGAFSVTWDVSGTDSPPVGCTTVDIDLLTFSNDQSTYAANRLKSAIANNGNGLINSLPDKFSSNARFRVSCTNNVFYAISDADLVIQDTGGIGSGVFETTGNSTDFSATNTCNPGGPTVITPVVSGKTGTGAIDSLWLLLLFSLSFYRLLIPGRCREIA
jgi:hypothetical protein